MKMIGMIFLDDNFKEVDLPKETCTKEEFKDFIHKVYYIRFTIPERMQWFIDTYRKHDEMNSIFAKKFCSIYSYDEAFDYWFAESDKRITKAINDIYLAKQQHKED